MLGGTFCLTFFLAGQSAIQPLPRQNLPTILPPAILATTPGWQLSPPTLPDIDLRLIELQALIGHYHRLCDALLEMEYEHELNLVDAGSDHPDKGRGQKRIALVRERKEIIRLKIEDVRALLKKEDRKAP